MHHPNTEGTEKVDQNEDEAFARSLAAKSATLVAATGGGSARPAQNWNQPRALVRSAAQRERRGRHATQPLFPAHGASRPALFWPPASRTAKLSECQRHDGRHPCANVAHRK